MAFQPLELQLDWHAYDSYGQGDAYAALPAQGEGFGKAAAHCIGSRQCQRVDKGVMCPSLRVSQDDLHSTRGRATLLREALDGKLGDRPFADGSLDAAMELCLACKGCKRECPNGVDMAALRAETLAQRWTGRRPPWRTRLFSGLPQWLPRLRTWRWALPLRERLPGLAWLGEQLLGITARRSLPRIAPRAFLDHALPEASPGSGRDVVLLVDCFANHLDPEIAAAALAPHLAAGRPVIGLEPSCLSMLRHEVHQLGLDAGQVRAVAKSALMLEEFLARELDARRWLPPPCAPTRALVHGHCHQKAFGTLKAMRKVLGAVPGLQVEWIESSCCGMAGSFGYEAEHDDVSMRMAELALLPAVRAADAQTLLLASGTSCRQQIRDGAGRESLHLAQLLQRLWVPA